MSVLLNKVTEVVVTEVLAYDGRDTPLPFAVVVRYDDTTEKVTANCESFDSAAYLADIIAVDYEVQIYVAPRSIARENANYHLLHDASYCPYCKSANIEASYIDPESMTQAIECKLCKRVWQNIFALIGVSDGNDTYFKDGYDETLSNNDAE